MATPKTEVATKVRKQKTKAKAKPAKAATKTAKPKAHAVYREPRSGTLADLALTAIRQVQSKGRFRFRDARDALEKLAVKKYGSAKKLPASFDGMSWYAFARVARQSKERGVWEVVKGR